MHLAARCVNDEKFMAAMRGNARDAVISCFPEGSHAEVLEKIQIRAEQNTTDVMHIAVPAYSVLHEMNVHLTEDQMGRISGGAFEIACVLSVTGVSTAAIFIGITKAKIIADVIAISIGAAVVAGAAVAATAAVAGVGVGIAAGLGAFDRDVTAGLVE